MRDYKLTKIYEGTANEIDRYTGNLTIGRSKLVVDKEIVVYDYESSKNIKGIISSTTRANIEKLKDAFKSKISIDKIYRSMTAPKRGAFSTFITGEIKGVPFIWSRKEVESPSSGTTTIHFETGRANGQAFIKRIETKPTTVQKTKDGLYRIHDYAEKTILYLPDYKEEWMGPPELGIRNIVYDIYSRGDLHRVNLPSIIDYKDKNSGSIAYYENGRLRCVLRFEDNTVFLQVGYTANTVSTEAKGNYNLFEAAGEGDIEI